MPGTIAGTGTRHLGRANLLSEVDTCAHCGCQGDLTSYDTELVFCLFSVPILRLGRRRVLRECPRCHGHQALRQEEWDRQRETELGPLIHLALHDRADPAKAKRLLRALLRLHAENRFLQFADLHKPDTIADAEIARLFAAGFRQFNRRDAEESHLRRCLQLPNCTPEDGRALTTLLIDTRKFAEAIDRVRLHLDEETEEAILLARRLIAALRDAGRRREAAEVGKEFAPALSRARARMAQNESSPHP